MENLTHLLYEDNEKKFHDWLKQEIELMREILANLHQEELCLMLHDKERYQLLIAEQITLNQKLNDMRKFREVLMHEIRVIALNHEILKDLETISLLNQVEMLEERMIKQSQRNQALLEHHPYTLDLPKISEEMFLQQNPQCCLRKKSQIMLHVLDENSPQ